MAVGPGGADPHLNPTSFTSSYLIKLIVLITCAPVNIIDN